MSWLDWLFGESTDKKKFDYINSVDKALTERISYIDNNNASVKKDFNERIANLETDVKALLSESEFLNAIRKHKSKPAKEIHKEKPKKARDRPRKDNK